MARKSQDKRKREKRKKEREELKLSFDEFHRIAPYVKKLYRLRGLNLPFYDFYDSYVAEFQKVAAEAKSRYSSLIDIIELDDDEYFSSDRSKYAPELEPLNWQDEVEAKDYALHGRDDGTNLNGFTSAFTNTGGDIKTLVGIRNYVPGAKPHPEFKYIMKFSALLHELGHVDDIERGVNFNRKTRACNIIEAEVYAQLYALERMAKMNYYHCYLMLVNAL